MRCPFLFRTFITMYALASMHDYQVLSRSRTLPICRDEVSTHFSLTHNLRDFEVLLPVPGLFLGPCFAKARRFFKGLLLEGCS